MDSLREGMSREEELMWFPQHHERHSKNPKH